VDIAGFYNRYHDLFSQEFVGSSFVEQTPAPTHLLLPLQFRNGLRGAGSGVEIAPEVRPTNWWRLKGSYSYLVLDLSTAPGAREIGTAPITERSSPRHQGVIQSEIQFAKNFEFDATYRGVDSLPGQRIPGYSTMDARLGWRIGRNLDISLVGRNLLQPWHLEFGNDPGPAVGIRRTIFVRLTWAR
jgi:iron complex outermembrane receptor protein